MSVLGRRGEGALPLAVFVVAAALVHQIRPSLAATVHSVRDADDVYLFPPPAELRAATLGYLSAATDVIWSKLLVDYGTHWLEHRPFPDLNRYVDAILALEPTYFPLYEYVDTLLCYRPLQGTEADARAARAYLERGTRELPDNADVWLHYGQFVAFLGPSFLTDNAERDRWRHDGAVALAHAVALGANVQGGIAAGSMLSDRFGETQAAIDTLERAYAVTDDEAQRADIARRLRRLYAGRTEGRAAKTIEAVEKRWHDEYPYLSRDLFLLIGPKIDPFACAGRDGATDPACAHDWSHSDLGDEGVAPP